MVGSVNVTESEHSPVLKNPITNLHRISNRHFTHSCHPDPRGVLHSASPTDDPHPPQNQPRILHDRAPRHLVTCPAPATPTPRSENWLRVLGTQIFGGENQSDLRTPEPYLPPIPCAYAHSPGLFGRGVGGWGYRACALGASVAVAARQDPRAVLQIGPGRDGRSRHLDPAAPRHPTHRRANTLVNRTAPAR